MTGIRGFAFLARGADDEIGVAVAIDVANA